MNILESKSILERQLLSKRTPGGRPITEYAMDSLQSCLEDEKNYNSQVVQCESCQFVISVNLTIDGCPNCGVEQLTTNVKE